MKRVVFTYGGIIISLIILTMILSRILNVGTENTWLAGIFVNIMLIATYKMFYDLSKIAKRKNIIAYFFIFFALSLTIGGLIMANVIIVGNLFFDMGW